MLEPWRTGKVVKIEDATSNTKRFWIEVSDVDKFDFMPGQFVTLDLPIHEKRNKRWRSYSIASPPDGTNVIELVVVLLEGGLGSTYLFNEIKEGSELPLRGPQGTFVLLHYIHLHNIQHQNIYLVFGCRTLSDCLYKEELEALSNEMNGFFYLPTFSRENKNNTGIHHGYVHRLYEEMIVKEKAPAHFFLCGWKNMIDEAKEKIFSFGYDRYDVHLELYG